MRGRNGWDGEQPGVFVDEQWDLVINENNSLEAYTKQIGSSNFKQF